MPAASFIVPAVGTLLGAGLQSRSANRATSAQQRANDQAVQLQREQMAEERRRYDAQQAAYAQWYRQQMDIRRQIAKRYGVEIPDYGGPGGGKVAGAPAGGTPGFGASGGASTPQTFALTLGNLMGKGPTNIGESQPSGPMAGAMPGAAPGPLPSQGALMGQPAAAPQPTGQTLGDMMGPNWSDWRNTSYG